MKFVDDKPPSYSGMTVNERLFVAGLMDAFDQAAKKRDGEAMVHILSQVALSGQDSRKIVKTILANPGRYGY